MQIKSRKVALALLAAGTVGLSLQGTNIALADRGSGGLTSTEQKLLNSGRPIEVVLDPTNGALVSVAPQSTKVSTRISNHNICNSGDGCYLSGRVPYANQGFYGSAGTYHGSWPYRSGYNTGSHTASACWTQACSQQALPPNTHATFSGSLVTGTSFTIH